ncbi:bifunctional 3'-phosphoadenosine 5'-phosphosulfate synthase-like [Diaphorina citri]|uniref:Bifunctional 3'-phosphoadenosine 5'-phosphosulfate synthase-like n=1 Tax=Diaphorina citri TaxID=121845 RepID=A0A3Q0JAI0_DIACI|nr:bifunctional 3'-phosphoadenosine 5'-phosphosulfate synthase-like [Diaphorina citri]
MANTSAAGGDSPKAKDVPLQYHHVTREKRRKLWNNKSQGCTVWFTGKGRKFHAGILPPCLKSPSQTRSFLFIVAQLKMLFKPYLSFAGKIKSFTGVSQPYEAPKNPDLILETVNVPVEKCANSVLDMIAAKGLIPARQANVATPLTINNNIIDDGNTVQNDIIEEQYVSHNDAYVEALPRLDIGVIDLQWVQVIAEGWSSPLKGFMREDEFLKTIHFNTLDSHVNQSVAIVLAVTGEDKQRLEGNKEIALYHNSTPVAILYSPEFYVHRKEERIARQFGTTHPGHPYIKHINASGDWLVGGEVKALRKILWSDGLDDYRLSPNQLRAKFRELGADAVFAFQLRNPIHNGHALLMQDTRKKLEAKGYKNPVLLLHPLGGKEVFRLFGKLPSGFQVQWHAKARRNAGANFYIVGRDPAGVPHPDPTPSRDLYEPTHGARVLSVAPGLSSLTILPFKVAAYNTVNARMEFFDPARASEFAFISGTKMRNYARSGETPPPGFMAPDAWNILAEFYNPTK